MDPDTGLRAGYWGFAFGALGLYVWWLFHPLVLPGLLGAFSLGIVSYVFLRIYVKRNPAPRPGQDVEPTEDEEEREAVGPSLRAGGIDVYFTKRTTRVKKK